jgi:aspartyl/glutamyl-tRNA(Asn/Gln) amidotransferase C subunit
VYRPDELIAPLSHDEAMANAPDQEDGRFKVPRIVEVE